jgi:pfkB family carbohydrate kinase
MIGGVGRNIATVTPEIHFTLPKLGIVKKKDKKNTPNKIIYLGKFIPTKKIILDNLSQALARLGGLDIGLLTAVAQDESGRIVMSDLSGSGIDISGLRVDTELDSTTATYTAIHKEDADLCVSIADMDIFKRIDYKFLHENRHFIQMAKAIVCDGNISSSSFIQIVTICVEKHISIFFEPTSEHKCCTPLVRIPIFNKNGIKFLTAVKPNLNELWCMATECIELGLICRSILPVGFDHKSEFSKKNEKTHPNSHVCMSTIELAVRILLVAMVDDDVISDNPELSQLNQDFHPR